MHVVASDAREQVGDPNVEVHPEAKEFDRLQEVRGVSVGLQADDVVAQPPSQLGGIQGLGGSLFTGPLGDILSSSEASTDGITGSLMLEIE